MHHDIDVPAPVFQAMFEGRRAFHVMGPGQTPAVGDTLDLAERDTAAGAFTGRRIEATLTDVQLSGDAGEEGLPDGWCVLGFVPVARFDDAGRKVTTDDLLDKATADLAKAAADREEAYEAIRWLKSAWTRMGGDRIRLDVARTCQMAGCPALDFEARAFAAERQRQRSHEMQTLRDGRAAAVRRAEEVEARLAAAEADHSLLAASQTNA